jgi:hypothetical protein
MREITPRLTPELEVHCKGMPVWRAPAFEASNFRALVEHVARLAYANPDELLFFRGQDRDYQSKAGGTTLYPAIYRGLSSNSKCNTTALDGLRCCHVKTMLHALE